MSQDLYRALFPFSYLNRAQVLDLPWGEQTACHNCTHQWASGQRQSYLCRIRWESHVIEADKDRVRDIFTGTNEWKWQLYKMCLIARSRVRVQRKKAHYELLKEMNMYVFG